MPWLSVRRVPPRPLPGPDWLRVRPILAGICGTDMGLLTGRASAAMSPFASFPAVLGHEVVGTVVEVGESAGRAAVGTRVVVDPVISCLVRGLDACTECAAGHPATCLRPADGSISPGLLIGYCRDLPGAWGDEMLVHRSQVHAVPDRLTDEEAVLVEPLSVALHALLRQPPADGSAVLMVGGGSLGLLLVAGLRLLGIGCEVTVMARHPIQAKMAARLGADRVITDGGRAGERAAATAVDARGHRTLDGRTTYSGGYAVVYDCVGSRASLDLAFRLAGPRGRVVNVGGPGRIGSLDWTPSWVRELTVEGSYVYGRETSLGGDPHTFAVAMRLLAGEPRLPVGELVTHRFALERWREAMTTNLGHRRGALKTVFDLSLRG